jgi:hypothetical protein
LELLGIVKKYVKKDAIAQLIGKDRYEDSVVEKWCAKQKKASNQARCKKYHEKIKNDPELKTKGHKRARKGLLTSFYR